MQVQYVPIFSFSEIERVLSTSPSPVELVGCRMRRDEPIAADGLRLIYRDTICLACIRTMSVCDVERQRVSSLKKPTVLTIKGLARDSLVRSLDGTEAVSSVLPSSQGLR
jgi:hypothetical protein